MLFWLKEKEEKVWTTFINMEENLTCYVYLKPTQQQANSRLKVQRCYSLKKELTESYFRAV